ncbi:MAG TPA: Fe-S cluster assembly protein SufD [Acidobacteriota bacterium]|nr:Fe-S cluster assembly protein SufD [Acidobacteriota bacterium]
MTAQTTISTLDQAGERLLQLAQQSRPWRSGRLAALRREALDIFAEQGLPEPRSEDWRHAHLGPVREELDYIRPREIGAARVAKSLLEASPFAGVGGSRIVFVDGQYAASLSDLTRLPPGVLLATFVEAQEDSALQEHLGRYATFGDHPFTALNTAGFEDGAFINIRQNVSLEHPLEIIFLSLGEESGRVVTHPRVLVLAEAHTKVPVVELHLGAGRGRYFSNPVTEIVCGENAQVDFLKIQVEDCDSFHFGRLESWQDRNATVRTAVITLSGGIVRNDTGSALDGEGGYADLDGLYLLSGKAQVDNFTRIEHRKPHCGSREVYKGILNDQGRGHFRGRIIVKQGAQGTDAKQTNKNLLLSSGALANTKPELEIYADDVKCTHGATIGRLDDEALFYLRSRGIGEASARSILIYAFAGEVVGRLHHPEIRQAVDRFFLSWLPRGEVVRAMAATESING